MHSATVQCCSSYVSDLVQTTATSPCRQGLRSSADTLSCSVPPPFTKLGEQTLSIAGPTAWNSLPFAIRRMSCTRPTAFILRLIAARGELRKVLFLALTVTFLFVYEISREPLNRLRQIHREDVFGPSLGWVWRSRSKVKGQGHQGQKRHFGPFGGLHAVYVK